MKKLIYLAVVCMMAAGSIALADTDTFGSGTANEFNIDFVPISGSTNPTSGIPAGDGFSFTGVNHDYRMGTYEVSNAQWTKFKSAYGTVTGSPSAAYDLDPYFTGTNVPTNCTSWYEAAQFVNYLNTSTGHQAAYKFTGTRGTNNYTFTNWDSTDIGYDASNPFRNSNAKYFLPTENEWVKAAYWNGTNLQIYATKAGETLFQGNGSNGGWNYNTNQPWAVGSGSQELNGTYDMMGNIWEYMENPNYSGNYYLSDSPRACRGGSYIGNTYNAIASFYRSSGSPYPFDEGLGSIGFRVASVPEPCSLTLLFLGGLALRCRKR